MKFLNGVAIKEEHDLVSIFPLYPPPILTEEIITTYFWSKYVMIFKTAVIIDIYYRMKNQSSSKQSNNPLS